jgi:hypothetical protein
MHFDIVAWSIHHAQLALAGRASLERSELGATGVGLGGGSAVGSGGSRILSKGMPNQNFTCISVKSIYQLGK